MAFTSSSLQGQNMVDKQQVIEIIHSPKVAAAVSAATTGTGLGSVLDLIPNDIGKLATLVGIILSVVLIRIHLLELSMLKKKNAEYERREKAES